MQLDEFAKDVLKKQDKKTLDGITRSEAGERLAARFDGRELEAAAKNGDMKKLSSMLQDILSTPEGRQFAQEVQKAVKRDER